MRVTVSGRDKKSVELLKKSMDSFKGFCSIDEKNPEIVVSLGGDGSFLYSERKFPGIPKLILRDKSICKKCNEGELKVLVKKLFNKEYKIKKYNKVEAIIKKQGKIIKKIGVNDIVIRNKFPYEALRFNLKIRKMNFNKDIIGDGIVVATAFGAGAYFYSITRKKFNKGFGIAFNNSTERIKPLILNEDNFSLDVKITRNDAFVSSDNDSELVLIKKGDNVKIKNSKEFLEIINIKS